MFGNWIKPFFIVAGLYDGILGLAFLLFSESIFQSFGVPPPNHPAYVHFPALLLLIFAAMFFRIARDPIANRELILYGVALKVAYCGSVFWYQANGGVPSMWIPWAWADIVFLVLFLVAWKNIRVTRAARNG
jgi:hypothetical protein